MNVPVPELRRGPLALPRRRRSLWPGALLLLSACAHEGVSSVRYEGPSAFEVTHDCEKPFPDRTCSHPMSHATFRVRWIPASTIPEEQVTILEIQRIERMPSGRLLTRGFGYGWPSLQATQAAEPNYVRSSHAGSFTIEKRGGFAWRTTARIDAASGVVFNFGDRSGGSPGWVTPSFPMTTTWGVWERLGEGEERLAGTFETRVRGTRLDFIDVVAPSTVVRGHPFRVLVRAMEGGRGKLDNAFPDETFTGVFELSCDDPKALLPERLELSEDEADRGIGVVEARLERDAVLVAKVGGLVATSHPIVVLEAGELRAWWGVLQCHTAVGGHAASSTPEAIRYARDLSGLDFVCVTEHDGRASFDWEEQKRIADLFNAAGSFVAFPGFETKGGARVSHRHVVYREGGESVYRGPYDDLNALYRDLQGTKVLVIPHHTGWKCENCPNHHFWARKEAPPANDLLRLFEIHSWHGCSEHWNHELLIRTRPASQREPGHGSYYQEMLERGWRLGVVAGSDNHLGTPGASLGVDLGSGHRLYAWGGLTGVWAPALERGAIWDALWERRTWGTTGARILLRFRTADGKRFQGEEIEVDRSEQRIALRIEARGTAPIGDLRVFRDGGREFLHEQPGTEAVDRELVAELAPGWTSFYVQLRQTDGHYAWSSPIWIHRKE